MYYSFYQLQSNPFGALPPEHPLFLTEAHKEALATLVYGLIERKPFVAIIGEVGTGKSTVLQAALGRVRSHPIRIVEVSHPLISPDRVTQLLAAAAGIEAADSLTFADIDSVDQAFLRGDGGSSHTALVIDEAQLVPSETLEFIRLVSNMKAAQGGFLQFLFVGQPEFWALLETEQFRHLRQRISLRCSIAPLSETDSRSYLTFRLQLVGATLPQTFTPGAVTALIKAAGGIPRRINSIADNALLIGFGTGTRPVTATIIRDAIRTLDGRDLPTKAVIARPKTVIAAGIAMLAAGALSWFLSEHGTDTPPPPPQAEAASPAQPAADAGAAPKAVSSPMPQQHDAAAQSVPAANPPQVLAGPLPTARAATQATSPVAAAPVAAPSIPQPAGPGANPMPPIVPPAPPPVAASTASSTATASPVPTADPAATMSPIPLASGTRPALQHGEIRYRVRRGDTVYSILDRYDRTIDDKTLKYFLERNPSITDSNRILEGTDVIVPLRDGNGADVPRN
jgi:general secretion pathway protein A